MPPDRASRNMTIWRAFVRPRAPFTPLSEPTRWAFPAAMQPAPGEVRFDLKSALDAVVALRADIPEDAFTAPILGTERTGSGVVIGDDGLVLTIGYLVTEAESIWLSANDGTVVPGHPIAYDFANKQRNSTKNKRATPAAAAGRIAQAGSPARANDCGCWKGGPESPTARLQGRATHSRVPSHERTSSSES